MGETEREIVREREGDSGARKIMFILFNCYCFCFGTLRLNPERIGRTRLSLVCCLCNSNEMRQRKAGKETARERERKRRGGRKRGNC